MKPEFDGLLDLLIKKYRIDDIGEDPSGLISRGLFYCALERIIEYEDKYGGLDENSGS